MANGQLSTDSCGAGRVDCSTDRASGAPSPPHQGSASGEATAEGGRVWGQVSSSTSGVTARWRYLVTRGPTNDGADMNISRANARRCT